MLESKSQALLSLPSKAILYDVDMSLGKRIKSARAAVPKLTQAAVARRLGVSPQAVSQWEREEDTPTPEKFPQLAQILGVDLNYLHGGNVKETQSEGVGNNVGRPTNTSHQQAPSLAIPVEQLRGEVDLPVHSIVQGGKGVLVLENDPFGYIARPRRLQGKPRGYGVLVKGDSMADEYNENDIAYVDPHLNPKQGDPCLFHGKRPDGTTEVLLRYLDRAPDASDSLYYVKTGRGAGKVRHSTIKKADWQKCYVLVGKESGR